jgi:alpha-L-rhamnosidase
VGFRFVLRALADAGRSDVVYKLITQATKPGYAWQLKQGATALTEAWDANTGASHNHFMLGQVTEWFYHDLAGIQPDPSAPGFRKIIFKPQPVGALAWVEARYDSVRGELGIRWEHRAGKLLVTATVPANTTATLLLPDATSHPLPPGVHKREARLP